jgi:hypothetical protein
MRAIQITGFGPPEVLTLATVPDPTPAPGQVRVRIHAIGVNGTVASGPKVPPAGSRVEPLSRPDGCRKCSKAINPGIQWRRGRSGDDDQIARGIAITGRLEWSRRPEGSSGG